ncbi:MAG: hypothetical protein RL223_2994, partial [Pseudomonadota bacterium]
GAPLTLTVHNPAADGIFPVNSVLVSGPTEAVLIDAQFQRKDAQALVRLIQASGKRLTTILISHGDPDYYFGLDVLQAAFPQARIVATAETVAHIQASKDAKSDPEGRRTADVGGAAGAVRAPPDGGRPDAGDHRPRGHAPRGVDPVAARGGGRHPGAGPHPRLDGRHAEPGLPPGLARHAARHRGPAPGRHRARPRAARRGRPPQPCRPCASPATIWPPSRPKPPAPATPPA